MTLKIDVNPREEAWLADQAAQSGLQPAEIVRRLIDAQLLAVAKPKEVELPPPMIDAKNAAAIALLDSWIAEGADADEETVKQAVQELEELKRNLNANRAELGERLVFP
jgi:hypothetical protein